LNRYVKLALPLAKISLWYQYRHMSHSSIESVVSREAPLSFDSKNRNKNIIKLSEIKL
jgi:hypothetical protein